MSVDTAVGMTTATYVIRGGAPGRERLRVLGRVMSSTTTALLDRFSFGPSATCLDVGCGGGDVTVELARRVPLGVAVGIDVDRTKLDLARHEAAAAGVDNVEFRFADVTERPTTIDRYDVVYSRFVLTHLADPAAAVTNMVAQLAPRGLLVVEDIDFAGAFCHPPSGAFDRFAELYVRIAATWGGDPNIGPRLPALLDQAGLADVNMNVVQRADLHGDVKLIPSLTLEAIGGAAIAGRVATAEELEAALENLRAFTARRDTVVGLPRVVQAWGHCG